jgi:hypothetical protein
MVSFDPYLNWLGIPPHEQPPNFYRLLGVVLFESNPEVIEQAADRQSLRVGAHQSGPQGEMCQQLLSEIAMARFCMVDPQQKAAYDCQLYEILSRRGECSVAAPPPPATMAGSQQASVQRPQTGLPPPQFSPQQATNPINPGVVAQGPFVMPAAQLPMQPLVPGPATMPGPTRMSMPSPIPQAVQLPPAMMAPPHGMASATPYPHTPVAVPIASPFPVATAVARGPTPMAPPTFPPAAPQRPIDELETLASQSTPRRHIHRKKKTDYSKEVIIGSVVAAAAVLLLVVYAAQDRSPSGYDAIKPDKPTSVKKVRDDELRERLKEKEKEKEKKIAAERASANQAKSSSVRPLKGFDRNSAGGQKASNDGDAPLPRIHEFGPPPRAMDSPGPGGPARTGPQTNGRDTPQDLGGASDPVFETPKPDP